MLPDMPSYIYIYNKRNEKSKSELRTQAISRLCFKKSFKLLLLGRVNADILRKYSGPVAHGFALFKLHSCNIAMVSVCVCVFLSFFLVLSFFIYREIKYLRPCIK